MCPAQETYSPPCVLEGVSHDTYHADPWGPSLSRSVAKVLLERSPLHAYTIHPRLGGSVREDDSSAAKDLGSLVHGMLLGIGPRIVTIDASDWRTKAAQEQRDAALAEGSIPVLLGRYLEAKNLSDLLSESIRKQTGSAPAGWLREATMLWEEGGVLCRARMDLVDPKRGVIWDIKITGDASRFDRSMLAHGLDIQWGAYTSGMESVMPKLAGRASLEFLVCETSPPFAVRRVRPAASMRDLGRRKWQRAVKIWGECLKSGVWPGYGDGVLEVEAPAWALQEDFSTELRSVGEPAWATED